VRRMLVTGAAGFIGANFVRYWMDTYPEDVIVVVDAMTYAGNKANLEITRSILSFILQQRVTSIDR